MFPVPHRWSPPTSSVYTPGGALRASQVPGESSRTSALLLDPGRATLPLSPQQDGVAPADQTTKATAIMTISRLNHTASVLAVYASRFGFPYTGKTRFRWVTALTGWVSNPLDSDGEFQVGFASLSIPTPQASPGATDLYLSPHALCSLPYARCSMPFALRPLFYYMSCAYPHCLIGVCDINADIVDKDIFLPCADIKFGL